MSDAPPQYQVSYSVGVLKVHLGPNVDFGD
uniref:Uncharacterized protein n=1 Tax=Arundo donax TaxID=35708 RepID=A0A0A9F1I8_ARUDO